MRRTEAGFTSRSRDETLIVQLCAKVAGVNISVHFSGVSGCAQELADELIHSDRFGTGNLDRTVYLAGDCHPSHRGWGIIPPERARRNLGKTQHFSLLARLR